jgi:predicted kinase
MGSGKSAIASQLAFELGAVLLRSDVVRKEMAGIPPTTPCSSGYDQGIYASRYTEDTYAELRKRAERVLGAGGSCIVDASFRKAGDRSMFRRAAVRLGVPFCIVETIASEEVIRERLVSRLREPGEVSDGRWEIFPAHKAEFEAVADDEGKRVVVDTSRGMAENVDAVLRALGVLSDEN